MGGYKYVIFGNGSTARVVHAEITHNTPHEVAGFCVDRAYLAEKELLGLPVVPFDEVEKHFPPDKYKMFVAVGYVNVNKLRADRYQQAKSAGYEFPNVIAKSAVTYPDLQIGDNCMIGSCTVIHPQVKIGNNVLIGSGCNLAHDLDMGDNCFLSDQVAIAGFVTVGPNCFIGTGAVIRNKVRVGRESVIGAAVAIMEDVDDRSVLFCDPPVKLPITSDRLKIV
jgi:sugar O-acyltransferase (sialic acid O-acetyltransferase NeuD family)